LEAAPHLTETGQKSKGRKTAYDTYYSKEAYLERLNELLPVAKKLLEGLTVRAQNSSV